MAAFAPRLPTARNKDWTYALGLFYPPREYLPDRCGSSPLVESSDAIECLLAAADALDEGCDGEALGGLLRQFWRCIDAETRPMRSQEPFEAAALALSKRAVRRHTNSGRQSNLVPKCCQLRAAHCHRESLSSYSACQMVSGSSKGNQAADAGNQKTKARGSSKRPPFVISNRHHTNLNQTPSSPPEIRGRKVNSKATVNSINTKQPRKENLSSKPPSSRIEAAERRLLAAVSRSPSSTTDSLYGALEVLTQATGRQSLSPTHKILPLQSTSLTHEISSIDDSSLTSALEHKRKAAPAENSLKSNGCGSSSKQRQVFSSSDKSIHHPSTTKESKSAENPLSAVPAWHENRSPSQQSMKKMPATASSPASMEASSWCNSPAAELSLPDFDDWLAADAKRRTTRGYVISAQAFKYTADV